MAVSDLRLLAVHGLVIKKAGSAPAVADVLGRPETAVLAALEAACSQGLAMSARGTFMATPAGRAWLDEQYPKLFRGLREDPAAQDAYARFERINGKLLALLTDWQMMPVGGERIPNDHSDPSYDADIIDRLGDLHERAQRPLGRFVELVPRLRRYLERLDGAYDRVLAGEHEWVSGARTDSYHTAWFELHEDLLRMLGYEREEQR
jgi:hypothetical protein